MRYTYYSLKPAPIQYIGYRSYYYRWNIEAEGTQWRCFEVTLKGNINANMILKVVLKALWGDGVEEKLLNDYNAAQQGVLEDSFSEPYLAFLTQRKALKEQIESDYSAFITL